MLRGDWHAGKIWDRVRIIIRHLARRQRSQEVAPVLIDVMGCDRGGSIPSAVVRCAPPSVLSRSGQTLVGAAAGLRRRTGLDFVQICVLSRSRAWRQCLVSGRGHSQRCSVCPFTSRVKCPPPPCQTPTSQCFHCRW